MHHWKNLSDNAFKWHKPLQNCSVYWWYYKPGFKPPSTGFTMWHLTNYAKDGVYLINEKNDNEHYGDHRGRTGHALVISFFYQWFNESECFLAWNPLHPKGNHLSKFNLVGVCCFGGVREQNTNKQKSHWYHIAL